MDRVTVADICEHEQGLVAGSCKNYANLEEAQLYVCSTARVLHQAFTKRALMVNMLQLLHKSG